MKLLTENHAIAAKPRIATQRPCQMKKLLLPTTMDSLICVAFNASFHPPATTITQTSVQHASFSNRSTRAAVPVHLLVIRSTEIWPGLHCPGPPATHTARDRS